MYSCHLFLMSSASIRSIQFLPFIVPIFARNVPLVSLIFLEEISSLSHSVVFLYYFALITEEVFLISPRYSSFSAFRWVYLSFSPLPFTSILFTAICKASSGNHFSGTGMTNQIYHFMANRCSKLETVTDYFLGLQNHCRW